jgi:glutamyl-Q tRNA(Asp) synthetase
MLWKGAIRNRKMTVTRFAPSPTGRLHLGHAFSALFAEAEVKEEADSLILRIEDIDSTRCRQEFTEGIIEDLSWLGIQWAPEVMFQSERFDFYTEALGRLRGQGLLYPCFCTRKDIAREIAVAGAAPHDQADVVYPGICRKLPETLRRQRVAGGEAHAWRLDSGKAVEIAGELSWTDLGLGSQRVCMDKLGDVVLARKDIARSYHLAVTVDDAGQGVTLVTRGEDLLDSTHVHRLLQELLELPVPQWHHHRLLRDAEGKRLAKREEGMTLRAIRESGKSAADVRVDLGF